MPPNPATRPGLALGCPPHVQVSCWTLNFHTRWREHKGTFFVAGSGGRSPGGVGIGSPWLRVTVGQRDSCLSPGVGGQQEGRGLCPPSKQPPTPRPVHSHFAPQGPGRPAPRRCPKAPQKRLRLGETPTFYASLKITPTMLTRRL